MEKVTLENAPRDLIALLSLTREQRQLLFLEIEESADEISPTADEFDAMQDQKQCEVLRELLLDYDDADTGYGVIPVTLPTRVKEQAVNEKRWEEFGNQVADALNSMKDAGASIQPIAVFEGHGVLIIGYKPSSRPRPQAELPQLFAIPLGEMLNRAMGGAMSTMDDDPNREAMQSIIAVVRRAITEFGPNDDVISTALEAATKDLADPSGFLEFVKEERGKHDRTCDDSTCIVTRVLKALEGVLSGRIKNFS